MGAAQALFILEVCAHEDMEYAEMFRRVPESFLGDFSSGPQAISLIQELG